jgi:uncharacterized protein (TIGR02246 family)
MNNDLDRVVTPVLSRIESAWNAADGAAFAEPFTTDADFVNIRGEFHHSQAAIGAGHQAIFNTVYKGSTVRYELAEARSLTPNVTVAHARATLREPQGPLAGEHKWLSPLSWCRKTRTGR